MKKIPIIIPLILMLTAAAAPPTWALYKDDDGATWYTVEELLDYRKVLDREEEEACGEDAWCKQEYFYNKMESEPRVSALEQLLQQQFVLTAVNPGEGYIKVMFFGEDMMLSRMGIREELGIDQVYIGWMEYDPERIYYGIYFDEYANGEIDGYHGIYAWRSGYEEENLIGVDEEVKLEAGDLANNASGQLVYAVDSGYGKFNAVGRFFYANCLTEPDYFEGAECKLMISNEKGQAYYPPRETILINNNNLSDNDDNALANEANNSNLIDTINDDSSNNVVTISNNGADSEIDVNSGSIDDEVGIERDDRINENSVDVGEIKLNATMSKGAKDEFERGIKAPDTGANSEPCNQKVVEFPWWLGALIIGGDVVVMWLFWPNRKKVQKNR